LANNPNGAAECSVEVFGSWVTETAPENLPVGVSPDCPDNVFAPGNVGTRPAFQKIFDPPLEAGATINYGKSFVTDSGDIKNLYLSSTGRFYVEDVTGAPGVATLLFSTTPNTCAKSITAFGREFIAISDGLHGQEVPLQFDGTNVDRVTQDGPGAPPMVANVSYPAVALAVSGSGTTYTVVSSTPGRPLLGIYRQLVVVFTVLPPVAMGDQMILSGSSLPALNGTYTVNFVNVAGSYVSFAFFSPNPAAGTGGSGVVYPGGGLSLSRSNNTVSGQTTAPHNLQIGYQALVAGVAATQVGGGVASIVINNEDNPGIATITTAAPHGLLPNNEVVIDGVPTAAVGGGIASSQTFGTITTIVTNTAHGLNPGSVVNILGSGTSPHYGDGQWTVLTVPNATTFTYQIGVQETTDAPVAGGTVSLVWPSASTNDLYNTFEVIQSPSATSFQVAITYPDGTWGSGGTVSFAWDGTFYVTAVPSPTAFEYQQYGPDATTGSTGTITPFGQVAPGLHQLQMSFLTRQGAITKPSPPVTFEANGGQYLALTNVATGPPNIVGRIFELTGALGSRFFYIPVPAQVNGLVVSTSTVLNDNTSTSAILDFSDNTLFAALGTSIPGNNLAAQIVLDGALFFLTDDERLGTAGQRNRLQTMLNMGFDGGVLPSAPTVPSGWTATGVGGAVVAGRFNGWAWQITTATGPGQLSQSFYQDCYGAPIGTANTLYTIRYYLTGNGTFRVTLSSASTGFSSAATIAVSGAGWYEATFSAATPATIPIDMLYTLQGTSGTIVVDEGSCIYEATPYLETLLFDSYVNNPEGFDGLSGKYGPTNDVRKVMAAAFVRGTLCLWTREPSGRLHEVIDNGTTEPAGWAVNELAANCGILSAFALTQAQADDGSASGGEEWACWSSESGARIFGGGDQWKISQEIQPNWNDPGSTNPLQINMAAALTAWTLNDPVARVVYFGLPIGPGATAPTMVYPMNYRELDRAETIASSPPFHPSLAGKLVATDNTRKWCYWQRQFMGAARMYRDANELTTCFFAGLLPDGEASGYGNVYLLNPAMSTDDDYGQIGSYYVTCALPTHDQEEGLQLGSQKKILAAMAASFTCVGNVVFTFFRNQYVAGLPYQWPITFTRPSCTYFDMEMGGGNPEANRMFIKMQPVPLAGGTDCRYQLERLIPWFRKAKIPSRGSAR
jgi:hypothetical protein